MPQQPQQHPRSQRPRFAAFPELERIPSPRGQVTLIERIGKGNFGSVYKATLSSKPSSSAVKIVPLKVEEINEILLEVYILKHCRHKNIVELTGVFLQGEHLWICMEYCGGGSVDSIYREIPKAVPEPTIAVLLYECLHGLDYLHRANYIHRDIKSGNLLLTESGVLKLADFGVSARLKDGKRARTFIGTPYWMSPELIVCDESPTSTYDCKVDIWALGITAIEIADKNPPLSDIHPMRALRLIPTAELGLAKPKNWSKLFVDFVRVTLTRDPARRPHAAILLKHPFIQKHTGQMKAPALAACLQDLLAKATAMKKKERSRHFRFIDEEDVGEAAEVPKKHEKVPPKVEMTKEVDPKNQICQAVDGRNVNPIVPQLSQPSSANEQERPPIIAPEMKMLAKIPEEVLCGDILQPDMLLIGTEKGLWALELASQDACGLPTRLIANARFRQIKVLEDYGVMMAVAGKNSHVRAYVLSSIRKLARYILKGSSVETPTAKRELAAGERPVEGRLASSSRESTPLVSEEIAARSKPDFAQSFSGGSTETTLQSASPESPVDVKVITTSPGLPSVRDEEIDTRQPFKYGEKMPHTLLQTATTKDCTDGKRLSSVKSEEIGGRPRVDFGSGEKVSPVSVASPRFSLSESQEFQQLSSGQQTPVGRHRQSLVLPSDRRESEFGRPRRHSWFSAGNQTSSSLSPPGGSALPLTVRITRKFILADQSSFGFSRRNSVAHGEDDVYRVLKQPSIVEPDHVMAQRWVGDFTKVLATRDTASFDIQRTATSAYMAVLLKQDIILFEWAKEPYSKFMKVKAFWLPESPKFISLQHDGLDPTFFIVGYASELNAVRISDAEVSDLPIPEAIKQPEGEWQGMNPLLQDVNVESVSVPHGTARKAAVVRAGQASTALLGQAMPRVKAKYYLATYGSMSSIVDSTAQSVRSLPSFTRKKEGVAMAGSSRRSSIASGTKSGAALPAPVFKWSTSPTHIVCIWNQSGPEPLELIAFLGKDGIEICSFRTGQRVNVFQPGAPVRLLTENNNQEIFFVCGKPRKPYSLYMMKR